MALARITIVTGALVVERGVSDQLRVDVWFAIIYNVITKRHIHLPESSLLFLEIHRDLCACNYYFVDQVGSCTSHPLLVARISILPSLYLTLPPVAIIPDLLCLALAIIRNWERSSDR